MNAERREESSAPHPDGEQLSALMDGELTDPECAQRLGGLCADAQARQRWAWWHCASDALRSSDVAALHSERFVARFSAALQGEPPLLAPRALQQPGRGHPVRRWALPATAVAAAAAVLAVVAVPQLRGGPSAADPLAGGSAAPAAPVAQQVGPDDVIRAADLEMYLAAHREQSAAAVMPRSASYLRTSVRTREVRR
jgi:sigma-E factor negative regulatory protein RseA